MAAARMRGAMAQLVLRSPMFAPGMPARTRLMAALSPETRAWAEGPMLPTEWFEERFAVELCEAVVRALNLGDAATVQQWFRRWHVQAFSGILKQVPTVRDPTSFAEFLPTLWSRQHDTGTFEAVEQREGYLRVQLRNNANATNATYAVALTGGLEAFLTIVGALGVRATHRTRRNLLEIELTWTGLGGLAVEP